MKKNCYYAIAMFMALGFKANAQKLTTVSATVGTQGFGLDVKHSPTPEYGLRAGFSILPISVGFGFTAQSTPSDVDVDADLQNAHLIFDWHPFAKADGFRKFMVSGGAGYFWKSRGTAVITPNETYSYGDIIIPPGEAGNLTGTIKWAKLAPYAGIGFESAVPKSNFNFNFTLGAYYMGRPETSLTGTGLVSVDEANERQLSENLKDYRFLPVIQLGINYTL